MHAPSESDRLAGTVDVTTIGDSLARAALANPDGDALVMPDTRHSYRELADHVSWLARGLLGLGVSPGDKVGILLPQDADNLATFIAITTIGGVAVPINSAFKARELAHLVVDSDMAVLVTSSDLAAAAELTVAFPDLRASDVTLPVSAAPRLRVIVDLGPGGLPAARSRTDLDSAAESVSDDELFIWRQRVRVRDVGAIIYTSGTTDTPKGALLTHETLVREGMMVARTRLLLTTADRVWSVLPFFHIGGIVFASACFATGATYVHAGAFRPATTLQQLQSERCTVVLAGFETIWLPVLTHADFATTDLSALRLVFCLGIPERMRRMQSFLPHAPVVSAYGSTETCSFITLSETTDPEESRMTTTGRPLPGTEVRVVDPVTGIDVPTGEVGEIVCRGWSRFEGYHNDPERTAHAIDDDGWYHSGDLGTLDEDGRIAWTSRLKDMLKVGGENVAALEIEGHLLGHPAVLMAQVVAAPDAHYTEVPAAYLMLAPGATVTEQEIIDHCLVGIAKFKVPRYVRFVDEWPMSGTKIQKFVLRERIAAELAERGIEQAPRLTVSPGPG